MSWFRLVFPRPRICDAGLKRKPDKRFADAARALAKEGHNQRRAKVRAKTRDICAALGRPVPTALED